MWKFKDVQQDVEKIEVQIDQLKSEEYRLQEHPTSEEAHIRANTQRRLLATVQDAREILSMVITLAKPFQRKSEAERRKPSLAAVWCNGGHLLTLTTRVYNSNGFACDVCRRHFDAAFHPSWHCD